MIDRREAALCVERGIERYAEGNYEEAKRQFEAAIAAHPGHVRAVECLAWVREVAAGRRTLQSGTYSAVTVTVDRPSDEHSREASLPREDGGDSVTREWSSLQTGQGLPVLDVPELSEEQIANLLDLDSARGFTLSSSSEASLRDSLVTPPPGDASPTSGASEEEDDEGEIDRTNVRLSEGGQVVELVADSEDDHDEPVASPLAPRPTTPAATLDSEPALTPLASTSSTELRRVDQTADDPPSLPTNPFISQRLAELAPDLLPKSEPHPDVVLDTPLPIAPANAMVTIEAALRRGALRDAFDAAERLADSPEPRTSDEQLLLQRVYETVLGDLSIVPRFVKATPGLDSKDAFLLSRMDGATSADDLLDVSGMPRGEAMRVLTRLVVSGAISMKR